jgi:putative oxidoreductase
MTTPPASDVEGMFENTLKDGASACAGNAKAAWSARYDWGLLLLRVWTFLSLFAKHGFEKLSNQDNMAFTFRDDPIHIGKFASFLCAAFADGICTLLIALGLGTRWAAMALFINLFVAWSLVTHFDYFEHTIASLGNHGEVIVLYMGACLAVAIAGPGRFSLDWKLGIDGLWPFRKKNSK